ncbi:hypothetical protein DOTSEDRAFT_44003 [Dothistroma septosporum NZE10]|uniref:Uncharacterized protein n=1 Tax=Dothistroma septosporum (strain NZE10 / CBS 128990) TaxID=675120 RepID=N1PTK7_DOTSN|nr:hypothetical protein DOTSEDRAFT_44003 [Dothistroma septosporum NZE10]
MVCWSGITEVCVEWHQHADGNCHMIERRGDELATTEVDGTLDDRSMQQTGSRGTTQHKLTRQL